jgi:formylglycine-generating enzyme required for sulfatase activity
MKIARCVVFLTAAFAASPAILEAAEASGRAEVSIKVGQTRAVFRKVSPRAEKTDYPDYYLLETEVTNQLYREYLRATKRTKDDLALVEAERRRMQAAIEAQRRESEARRHQSEARRLNDEAGIEYRNGRPYLKIPSPTTRPVTRPTTIRVDVCILNVFSTGSFDPVSIDSLLWRRGDYQAGLDEHPVAYVTLAEAEAFCEWLSKTHPERGLFRLPTWNEWMIAAYGARRSYPWGDDWRPAHAHLGFDRKSKEPAGTEPVKDRPNDRTPEGLFGMLGNVAEYLAAGDSLNREYYDLGSRWMGGDFDHVTICTVYRKPWLVSPRNDYWGYRHETEWRSQGTGFRVLLDPSGDKTLLDRPRVFDQVDQSWRTLPPAKSDRERKP